MFLTTWNDNEWSEKLEEIAQEIELLRSPSNELRTGYEQVTSSTRALRALRERYEYPGHRELVWLGG